MANITTLQPIRYTQDTINTIAHGLVISPEAAPLNLNEADAVTAITFITDPTPLPAQCECRIVFNTGQGWFKLTSNGTADSEIQQDIDYESVIEEGNTILELGQLQSIPAFEHAQLRYAIALNSQDMSNIRPKVRFNVTCETLMQQLTQTVISPKYEFTSGIIITNITADGETTGGATQTIQASYRPEDEEEAEQYPEGWSDWVSLQAIPGRSVKGLQYRVISTVPQMNTAHAILRSIKAIYNEGGAIAVSDGVSSIVTNTSDWRVDLRYARVVVRHSYLDASYITVYATFRGKTEKVTGEIIGYGNTQRTVYELAHKDGIKLDTVRLYYNGVGVSEGYDVNCETGRIIVSAPDGVTITCDYEYGWADEQWVELELSKREEYEGYWQSTYRVIMPENASEQVRSIAGIKIDMHMTTGNEVNELIGMGTGTVRTYKLRYPVKSGIITVRVGGVEQSSESYELQTDTRYIRMNAEAGQEIRCDYDWESEPVQVYQLNGIFSE